VRFPQPEHPVRVRILKRDERGLFSVVWSTDVDPAAQDVIRKQPPAPVKPIPIRISGPSSGKVDLLIMGDGYTAAEMGKFEATARKLAEHLFTVSPFLERANDFNVWAMARRRRNRACRVHRRACTMRRRWARATIFSAASVMC